MRTYIFLVACLLLFSSCGSDDPKKSVTINENDMLFTTIVDEVESKIKAAQAQRRRIDSLQDRMAIIDLERKLQNELTQQATDDVIDSLLRVISNNKNNHVALQRELKNLRANIIKQDEKLNRLEYDLEETFAAYQSQLTDVIGYKKAREFFENSVNSPKKFINSFFATHKALSELRKEMNTTLNSMEHKLK